MAHAAPPQQPAPGPKEHKPFVASNQIVPEFTLKAVIFGCIFGVLFGVATVYLALKAGLTVSASIPIAVLSISVLKYFGRPTILENNIVQTIGSAGESIAAGVAFTIPGLLFLSAGAGGASYFNYVNILMLAAVGGILGVLFMVPLRRALIVGEHGVLPYPEGTACAEVLIAGEKGGKMAKYVFSGVAVSGLYGIGLKIMKLWEETVVFRTTNRGVAALPASTLPNASIASEVTPELLGVGYILGPRVGGIMVSGGILSYLVLIPLLSLFISEAKVVEDLTNLGFKPSDIDGMNWGRRFYRGYVQYIGAGAVTMAGLITLTKTLPTIIKSVGASLSSLKKGGGAAGQERTERDIPISVVAIGSIALVGILALLPILPGTFGGKIIMGVLMLVFGFLFVTVSSRIVGLIGSSSNPISGMTIATLLGTALVFLTMGMGGDANQPVALCVGAIVCIAAANAGATSQDLKTGFLVGATPIRQQIGLIIGVLVSVFAIGFTLQLVDRNFAPNPDDPNSHGIGGDVLGAPQAQLMATVIKGVMSQNLPWAYVLLGAGLSLMVFLAGVSPLAWAVGAYLPFGTSFTIFLGGLLRALVDKIRGGNTESEISPGMLFATGMVAGGSLAGVAQCLVAGVPWSSSDPKIKSMGDYLEHMTAPFRNWQGSFGAYGSQLWALGFFALLALILVKVAMIKTEEEA